MATTPRKKPKIMAPRKHGPDFSVDQTWEALSKNIKEIQNQNASNLSFEENHRFAYNMVLYKHGEKLYDGVKELVIQNLEAMGAERIVPAFPTVTSESDANIQNADEERLLKAVRRVWNDHTGNMFRLGQILKYMDRVHTKDANVPDTQQLRFQLFLKHIIKYPIKDHVVAAILNQVKHERDGLVINKSAVKECVDIYLTLQGDAVGSTIYKRDLEPEFLSQSQAFYEKEGLELVNACDASEFLFRAEGRIDAEQNRTNHYLSSQTTPPLLQILKDHLVSPHLGNVIAKEGSGLDFMIDGNKLEDLNRLYRLCLFVPSGIPTLRTSLKASIVRRGKLINQASLGENLEATEEEPENPKGKGKAKARNPSSGIQPALNWVQNVLDLKDKFDLLSLSFLSGREVAISIEEAFGTFVNMNQKCSEFISLFIDDHLKSGLKGKSDDEVDAILDKTISLFRFIAEKDVFEKYYKRHLARRLLYGRSVSDDAERGMLVKLKVECGIQFTQKMEGMFNDMRISADTTKDYLEHVAKTTAPNIEINVTVMTSNAWPMNHSSSSCLLPPEMSKSCKSFEQFYLSKHSGRRLTWQLSLGNADVHVRFKTRSHELNVATFALVILLLFEDLKDGETLSYNEIKGATQIEEVELKRHLQSLACAKFKVLKKHPHGRDIHPTDEFSFNDGFSCQMTKVKIATVSVKVENPEEQRETRDRIEEERKYLMEACIVRIMKDRKHMTHNDLVNEVIHQLTSKFLPDTLIIKKRIEHLIDAEYLERCDDRKSYNYLA